MHLSSIFKWFGDDFKNKYLPADGFGGHKDGERAVLNSVSKYVSGEDAKYLPEGSYRIKYLKYDWSLNERASVACPKGATLPATRETPRK